MYNDDCAAVAHDADHNSGESLPQFGAATSSRGQSPTPVPAWQPPRNTIPARLRRGTWHHPPGTLPNLIPARLTLTLGVNSHHCYCTMRETSLPTSVEPLEKRRRVELDSDGDEEGDDDDDQEQDEETLRRRFARPNKSIPQRIRHLLDVAAEDSDEDGEPEDENEEATLSDKEFLDDQAQDDGPIRPPSLPEYRDEHNNDLALAAYYESAAGKYRQETPSLASTAEEGQLPVVPGTWVCPRRGKARGQLAFVLTATKLYIGSPPVSGEPASAPITSKKGRVIQLKPEPLKEHLSHSQPANIAALLALTFEGPCPALAEGDRVVVVAGEHKEMNGFIAVLLLPGDGGAYHIKKQDKGAHVELTHLKRAGLDFGYKFLGRVMDVANDRLTISIPNDFDVVGPTTASAVSPHIKLFTIEIGHVSRVWYLGDSVRVRWDEHKGRTGVIVASNVGGILEIFDDRATDALNRMGEDEVAGMYALQTLTPTTISANPTAVTVGHKTIASEPEAKIALMRVGLRYEYLQVYVGSKSRHKGLCGMVVGDYDSPARAARLKKKREKGKNPWWDQKGILVTIREELTNHRVEGIPIESVYHQFTTLPLTKARFLPRDILLGRGAFPVFAIEPSPPRPRTPCPDSSDEPLWGSTPPPEPQGEPLQGSSRPPQLEGEPLQASSHPPQLEGEITGEWMCIPDLAHKRVDVQVVGIKQLPGRVSQTMLALEGKFGYLLLAGPASIVDKKIEVFGVGKHGTKHAIDRTCIKPRRQDDIDRRLWEITERVVVLGPNVHSDTRRKGHYAQTIPYLQHTYGPDVVGVKFEGGGPPDFFHMSSLCLAKT
ncbi:hypothetical protein B0H14DRAFT_3531377 [Mycena olivaceomarginata]|nr:hypothetical protein B0H14DRAFT_3531377 [Mycena olivaceomarginata]